MKRRSLALAGLSSLALGTALAPGRQAWARPEPALTPLKALKAYTEHLPPLNYLDASGQAQGFSVDLLRLIAAEAELPLDIELMPWPRAASAARAGPGSLLFSLTRTPARERQYQWLGPIGPRRLVVYRLSSRKDIQLSSLRELGGLRLGVVRESAALGRLLADGLRPGRELELALDDAGNLRKLQAGRMDLMLMLDWAAAWNLQQLKLPPDLLSPVLDYDSSHSYWYGLHPDTDPALLRRLQLALDRLRKDGRMARLRQRYLVS